MKFSGNVHNGTKNRRLNVGGDPDHHLNSRISKEILIIALISNIGDVWPWRRYALSEYSCFTCDKLGNPFPVKIQFTKFRMRE